MVVYKNLSQGSDHFNHLTSIHHFFFSEIIKCQILLWKRKHVPWFYSHQPLWLGFKWWQVESTVHALNTNAKKPVVVHVDFNFYALLITCIGNAVTDSKGTRWSRVKHLSFTSIFSSEATSIPSPLCNLPELFCAYRNKCLSIQLYTSLST